MNIRNTISIGFAAVLIGCGGGGSDGVTSPPPPPPPPPPGNPVNVGFALADFTGVKIDASFDYSIRQGNDFSVEITIDSSFADDLDVLVDGDIMQVGFKPNTDVRARTLEAVIVMPDINRIDLTGSVNGTVAGFSGNTLDILLSGSAVLEGINLSYNYVTVNGNGSAQFDMSDVAALPAADIQLVGSGSVTLNLTDFATVTGALSGDASLFYYGSNVNLQVTLSNTASITRLGKTL